MNTKWTTVLLLGTLVVSAACAVALPGQKYSSVRYLEAVCKTNSGRGSWFTLCTGLTLEQEAWLESVIYRNISTTWPQLSLNQSTVLLKNIRAFQSITEVANYPYHQAGVSI